MLRSCSVAILLFVVVSCVNNANISRGYDGHVAHRNAGSQAVVHNLPVDIDQLTSLMSILRSVHYLHMFESFLNTMKELIFFNLTF